VGGIAPTLRYGRSCGWADRALTAWTWPVLVVLDASMTTVSSPRRSALSVAAAVAEAVCAHPIQVVDRYGRLRLVRCGSRLAAWCPACSRLVVGDWSAIIRSGVYDPPMGETYEWLFLTLTAPSYGRVHRVPRRPGSPQRCGCGRVHGPDDGDLRGAPLDPSAYDYDRQVSWNRDMGALWDRTRRRLERLLGDGLSYAVVREWQARGVLHVHAIVRVPGEMTVSPVQVAAEARAATASVAGRLIGWGEQVDCRRIPGDPADTARHIGYLAKMVGYSVKSVGSSAAVPASEHALRLDYAAARMDCGRRSCRGRWGGCRAVAHRQYGARASVVSVSQDWSFSGLTRAKQRADRQAWVEVQSEEARAAAHHARQAQLGLVRAASRPGAAIPARRTGRPTTDHAHRDPPSG